MGTIVGIDRQKRLLALNGTPNRAGGSGQVLMFTGVRYERNRDGRPARPGFNDAAVKAAAKPAKNG